MDEKKVTMVRRNDGKIDLEIRSAAGAVELRREGIGFLEAVAHIENAMYTKGWLDGEIAQAIGGVEAAPWA